MGSHIYKWTALLICTVVMTTFIISCTERANNADYRTPDQNAKSLESNRTIPEESPGSVHPAQASFHYPLEVGRKWHYYGEFYTSDPLTRITRSSEVQVADFIVLPSHTRGYRLHEVMIENNEEYVSDTYFSNEEDGFYHHGYEGGSFASPLKGTLNGVSHEQYRFNGRTFNSLTELLAQLKGNGLTASSKSLNEPCFYDPPLRSIEFPPKVDHQWNFRPAGEPFLIDKRIVGYGPITVIAGTLHAFEIEWLYDIDADGAYDENIRFTDYISGEGLVKRRIELFDIERLVDGKIINTLDVADLWELTRYSTPTAAITPQPQS